MSAAGRSLASGSLLSLLLLCGPAPTFGQITAPRTAAPDSAALKGREQVRVWLRAGRIAQADSLAGALLRRAEGGPPLDLARALDAVVAVELVGSGSEPATLERGGRALALKEGEPEAPPSELALSLAQLGKLLGRRGRYGEAEPLLLRCLALRRTAPVDSLALAAAHNELGTLYTDWSRYDEAERHYLTDLAILEDVLGPEHGDLARTLSHLGRFYYNASRYPEAERAYERALAVARAGLGPRHMGAAFVLNGLAGVQEELGWMPEARASYEEALSIARERLGEDHALVVSILSNLARHELSLGDARAALARFAAVLEPTRAAYGRDHRHVAAVLSGMADAQALLGHLEEALRLNRESLRVLAATRDSSEAPFLLRRHQLGAVLRRLGRFDEAEKIQRGVLAGLSGNVSPGSTDIPAVRHELGRLLLAGGRQAEALPELQAARRGYAAALPAGHPLAAEVLVDLAAAHLARGQRDSSLACALAAEEISRRHAGIVFLALPQSEALHYASRRASAAGVLTRLAGDGFAVGRCWDALLRSRAQVLATVGLRQRILHLSPDPVVRERARAYAEAARRCAHLLIRGGESEEVRAAVAAEARQALDEAERAWIAAGGEGLRDREAPALGIAELRDLLPPRAALVGCFQAGDPERLTAFVLAPTRPEAVAVDLGPSGALDAAVRNWLEEARRGAAGGPEDDYRRAGEELRRLVWDPLRPHLEGSGAVFVVPAGQLHRLHLATLPAPDGGYLVEGPWRFHYLTREADLARAPATRPGSGLLLALGGPDYDRPGAERPGAAGPAAAAPAPGLRGEPSPCPALRSLRFVPLPASAREGEEVGRLWRECAAGHSAQVLTAAAASEEALKRLAPGAEILHLATHGFVLGEECASPSLEDGRGLGAVDYIGGAAESVAAADGAAAAGEAALQIAGLALAGANLRDGASAEAEDGILTAEEIATLDLTGVRLAVLSACDTGGGEIHSGEGVLGLRRAFQLAGAGSLVMTLWPVRDEVAREWMVRFYRARAVEGATVVEAVHAASLDLLRRGRQGGGGAHPAHWGAFVGCGDWR